MGAWTLELVVSGSLGSEKRAAAIMSLIQSARMHRHDPFAFLKDVLTRLPKQRASEIDQLLPHQWVAARSYCFNVLVGGIKLAELVSLRKSGQRIPLNCHNNFDN